MQAGTIVGNLASAIGITTEDVALVADLKAGSEEAFAVLRSVTAGADHQNDRPLAGLPFEYVLIGARHLHAQFEAAKLPPVLP